MVYLGYFNVERRWFRSNSSQTTIEGGSSTPYRSRDWIGPDHRHLRTLAVKIRVRRCQSEGLGGIATWSSLLLKRRALPDLSGTI